MFVFNAHFPLNPGASEKSARLIAAKRRELCGSSTCFVAADFNCDPKNIPAREFEKIGMHNCAEPLSKENELTMKLFASPIACVDAVFASKDLSVLSYEIFGKESAVEASDHHGIFLRAKKQLQS